MSQAKWRLKCAPPNKPAWAVCLVEDCGRLRLLPKTRCPECEARAKRASKLVAATGVRLSRVELQGRAT